MIIQQIIHLLRQQNICSQTGEITFHFMEQNIPVITKDIIGGVLQDWFGNWLRNNNIYWNNTGIHTQSWPDFILDNNEHLEFKTFDSTTSPNFDLANFDAYTRSLLTNSERLDTNHLIFAYHLIGSQVHITDFYVKKIWEMTGPSVTNILNLQVKQGIPYNIRPKKWYSPKVELFQTRRDFVIALDQALQRFHPDKYPDWFTRVCSDYHSKTQNNL
ncbi:NgoBV family restriction endonuclease [Conchiformibius steedae]|uniref:NgoBV family restriction endonuclease n=1 Tax=Conchiformibius steedae TaxID=153493 RepID=UPI0026EA2A74|nr:NgoBV family restriction endonuclease [Conchiformibius steedae]